MKSQYFLAVPALLYSLFVSVNGAVKCPGRSTQYNNGCTSTQHQELQEKKFPICDMDKYEVGEIIWQGLDLNLHKVMKKEDEEIFVMGVAAANLSKEIEALSHMHDIVCVGLDQSFFIMDKVNIKALLEAK